jgi:hypothetical protein
MRILLLIVSIVAYSYSLRAQTSITIDSTLQTSTCNDANIIVWFKTTGSFSSGNLFRLQLVSQFSFPPLFPATVVEVGSFPVITLPPPFGSGLNKTIIGRVPEGTPAGIYNVRIISTNPVDTSADYTCVSPVPIGGGTTSGIRCIILTQNTPTTPPAISAKCERGNTILTLNPEASSYEWSNGSTTQSTTVATGGTYSVKTTDPLGCATETTIELPINTIQTTCVGESTMLTSSLEAGGYSWSIPGSEASVLVKDTTSNKLGVVYYLETSNPFSCASSPIVYNSQCAIFNIDVYPNPTKGIVNIRIANDFDTVRINVINSLGQIVYSELDKKITPYYTKQLDLIGLNRGIYFIELVTKKNKRTFKLVINY